jgi:oligoribonuclease
MDKEFLKREMPNLMNHLHYRIVDVSTVKELSSRWFPSIHQNAPRKQLKHRYDRVSRTPRLLMYCYVQQFFPRKKQEIGDY